MRQSFFLSLAECFARGFDLFPQMIANGEFDRALVRPRPLVFQVLAAKMEFTRIGRLLQAFALVFAMYCQQAALIGSQSKC